LRFHSVQHLEALQGQPIAVGQYLGIRLGVENCSHKLAPFLVRKLWNCRYDLGLAHRDDLNRDSGRDQCSKVSLFLSQSALRWFPLRITAVKKALPADFLLLF